MTRGRSPYVLSELTRSLPLVLKEELTRSLLESTRRGPRGRLESRRRAPRGSPLLETRGRRGRLESEERT